MLNIPFHILHNSYSVLLKLGKLHTFTFGERGELGLANDSERRESLSLPEFMSFSITQRSSNNASKSTSPLPAADKSRNSDISKVL